MKKNESILKEYAQKKNVKGLPTFKAKSRDNSKEASVHKQLNKSSSKPPASAKSKPKIIK